MSSPNKPRYRTTNWKQYNAALKARGSLSIWLDICVTSNNVSDASVLPDLLEQLPPDETLQSLIGDGVLTQ